jgi:nitrite reductase/ring-hydroxylating ferredoxin subunit
MQPFNTLTVGAVHDLQPGACVRVELPDGQELAVCNVNGEYYAIDNFCPHKGAPLSEGMLCGHVLECGWHGWQFDVRSGECLTVREILTTYEVLVEDGLVKVIHRSQ